MNAVVELFCYAVYVETSRENYCHATIKRLVPSDQTVSLDLMSVACNMRHGIYKEVGKHSRICLDIVTSR